MLKEIQSIFLIFMSTFIAKIVTIKLKLIFLAGLIVSVYSCSYSFPSNYLP